MKELILAIILISFIATTAQAVDVVITITIPNQHVSRVSDAVINGLDCGELGTKVCLKRELVQYIKRLVRSYEASQIIGTANTEIDALVDPEIN